MIRDGQRPTLVVAAALLALSACGPGEIEVEPETPPNVLLVVLDTVRADALSCYGNPRPTTPNLDRLAAEGTRFDTAYATCFWTLPSHASLFTGLYPSEAGATSETNYLPEQLTTLAERLAKAGYRTGAVVRNAWISEERGFAQGFEDFVEDWRDDTGHEAEEEGQAVDLAAVWIDDRVGAGEPWFLFVNLNIAHLPYTPPEPYRLRFARREWSADEIKRLMAIEGGWGHLAGRLHLNEEHFELLRDLYAGEVAIADELVGRLIDAIEERGVLDETLVIVTSDHGENIGDHGLIDHVFSLYDSTVRVPLIVRYPPRFETGEVVSELVSLVDIAPTVLDIVGVPAINANLPGFPLDHPAIAERPSVFAENGRPINGIKLLEKWFPEFDTGTIDHPMRMIRTDPFKLIWTSDVSAELFNVESDPGELINLSSGRPDLSNQLLAELRSWSLGVEPRATPQPFESRDEESLERLRALGYVE
jgi:arylsulfatase A-like enzyme